ncbi:hypothetical protein CCMA1212_000837 [Trichoderma ghanense]|uniref:Uncharacterized protein n=1 Tax=Trichoderma ghanense TaxID=65468 RepID=A0ABY2HH98_9HYPO
MEPPAKRRRMSQLLLDKDNADEDDDELAFRPFEVEAKRDPDYKLSVERAYADQRFQATMAHIFEKYGRDFEGIGDEIDLVTGEIVVNNGHVRNMRDEGDVGDGLRGDLMDGEDDEDEGILLEDLYGDEEEYEEEETREKGKPVGVGRERAHNGDDADDDDDDDDDEDRIIQGRQATRDSHSTALVLGSSSRNALLARTSPFGAHNANPLHFEPPTELPFASSAFTFDRSPCASEPWGFPGQYADPLWDRPDLFTVQRPPSQQLPLKPSRYHFPARSGESSIWAPGSRFRADEEPLPSAFAATFGKHLLPKRKKILKHPLLLPSTKPNEHGDSRKSEAEEQDEEDEDVILTGKRSRENPTEATGHAENLRQSNNSAGEEAGERGGEGTSSDSGYKSAQSTRRSRKRKQRADDGSMRDEAVQPLGISRKAANSRPKRLPHKAKNSDQRAPSLELPAETNGCRRSGRMRKQVEYLNKISWAQALAEQRAEKQAMLLPASDSQKIDGEDDDEHAEMGSSTESKSTDEDHAALTESEHDCIPDSAADDDDDDDDDDEEEEEIGEAEVEEEVEAEKEQEEGDESEEREEEEREVSPPIIDLATSHEPQVRQSRIAERRSIQVPAGFPFKTTDSGYLLSDDEAPTSLSKPRKSISQKRHEGVLPLREIRNVKAQAQAEISSSDAGKEGRQNQSGKKRRHKADAVIGSSPTGNKSSSGHPDVPSEDSSGVAPLSSSPTRFLSRITLKVSLDDTPQPSDATSEEAKHQLEAIQSSSPIARVSEDALKPTTSKQRRRQSRKPVSPVIEQLNAAIGQLKQPVEHTALPTVIEDSSHETCDDLSPVEPPSPAKASLHDKPAPPSPNRTLSSPEAAPRPSTQSPSKVLPGSPIKSPTKKPSKRPAADETEEPLPSQSNPPQTPRRPHRRLKVPSSRHSILSLLSDDEDEDEEIDELGRNLAAMPLRLQSSVAQTTARKVWRSSSRTREVYRTPVKKRPSEPVSPGSLVKTPGGTLRACGVDGYRCGRDFCFTCL